MTVLVTGATGFIGARLVTQLAGAGIPVRAVYRREHPTIPGVDWRELPDIAIPPSQWTGMLADVVSVVHLAGLAHQIGHAGEGRRGEFFRVNAEATSSLAQACASAGVQRLVFLSSIAARTAELCPESPQDYGSSKLEAERLIGRALAGTGTTWCCLRPPLVYGPGNPGNMARLLSLIRRQVPLPFSAIRNRRSFIFVDNLTDAILTVLRHEGRVCGSFAIADGTDLSTPDLVRALARGSDCSVRMLFVPVPILRILGWVADQIGVLLGRSLPFDTYSINRLTESLSVDSAPFRAAFGWEPPVETSSAIAVTCQDILRHESSQTR